MHFKNEQILPHSLEYGEQETEILQAMFQYMLRVIKQQHENCFRPGSGGAATACVLRASRRAVLDL